MSYCKHCGYKLKENAKFCIGCGKTSLENNSSSYNDNSKLPEDSKGNKNSKIILATLLGAILIGGIFFFTGIFDKKKANTDNNSTSITQNASTGISTSEIKVNESNTSSQNYAIVENKVRNYFNASTQKDASTLYNNYLQYCTRYYDKQNANRDIIISDMNNYWSYVTDIQQNIKNVEVTNYNNLYQAIVTMDYNCWNYKEQNTRYITNLKSRVVLDNNFNIIEIYEISRNQ